MQRFDILDPKLNVFQSRFLEASAGTGKTFAIEHLIVRLLLESEEPVALPEILAVTFTREAAQEMKSRIRAILEKEKAKNALAHFDEIQVFTIHGFCHRMLSEFAFEAEAPLKMSRLDQPDHLAQMRGVVEDFFRTGSKEFAGEVTSLLKRMRYDFDRLVSRIVDAMQKGQTPTPYALPKLPQMQFEKLWNDFLILAPRYKRMRLEKYKSQVQKFAQYLEVKDPSILTEEKIWFFEKLKEKSGFFHTLQTKLGPPLQTLRDPEEMVRRVAKECRERWNIKAMRGDHFTFDDLLHKMRKALEIPAFYEKVRAKYKAVIVDEFQDTDPIQWEIFEKLFLSSHLLYLVGDPKQSIYGFRSADIYTYMQAAKALGEEKKAFLDTNFRSSPQLIEALNTLFTKTPEWIALPSMPGALTYHPVQAGRSENKLDEEPITYFGVKADPGRERSWPTKTMEEEKLFPYIANEILRLKETFAFSDFVVLIKDRFQAVRLQLFFNRCKIPSTIKRTVSLAESRGFLAMEMLLKAIAHPENDAHVRAVLRGPLMGSVLGKNSLLCLAAASPNSTSFSAIAPSAMPIVGRCDSILPHSPLEANFCPVQSLMEGEETPFFALRDLFREKGFAATFSHFLANHFSSHGDTSLYLEFTQTAELLMQSHKADLFELLHLMQGWKKISPEENPELSLRGEEGEDKVSIMTTFGSKGLEFEVVFALGMASCRAAEEQNTEKEAENMRQLYVSFTRAREKLYIPRLFDLSGKWVDSPIERFFQNIDVPIQWIENILMQKYKPKREKIELKPPPKVELDFPIEILTSFSSMAKGHATTLLSEEFHLQDLSKKSPHTLPLGAETGTVIHSVFENHFQNRLLPIEQVVCETLTGTHLEGWEEVIAKMANTVLHMPLFEGFSLSELEEGEFSQEMEFLFPQNNRWIKGFADLVFKKGDVFYVLDWKTNWLGSTDAHYTQERLHQAMEEHDYYLQAKIYGEAVQRYVKRLYTSPQFGGAFYVFLRGKKAVHFGNS